MPTLPPEGSALGRAGALLGAAHPLPTLAVTAGVGGLGAAAGLPALRLGVLVLAVLTGQLSIGWSNDRLDRRRDSQVGRADKPLAAGRVTVPQVRAACAVAAVLTVPLSLAAGLAAGLLHLVCVGCGWAYNLGLKSTVWSWAPYAVCFGALPSVAFLAAPGSALAPWWLTVAGALLGVGAHLVNVAPDREDDAATGVRGLPHRLAPRTAARLATLLLLTATAVVTVLAPQTPAPALWVVLAAAVGLAAAGLRGAGRTPFRAAVGIALLDVVALAWVL